MRTFQIAVLASALLLACADEPVARAPAPRPKPPPAAAQVSATPSDAEGGSFTYQYNPVAKRDPFRAPERSKNPVNEQCNEPLCQFDLDQLTLVGVVTGMASPFAMVEDPDGKGHIIRKQTRIGRQGGRVSQILRDSVTISEVWTTPDGKQINNPVSMQLQADRTRDPELDLQTGQKR